MQTVLPNAPALRPHTGASAGANLLRAQLERVQGLCQLLRWCKTGQGRHELLVTTNLQLQVCKS